MPLGTLRPRVMGQARRKRRRRGWGRRPLHGKAAARCSLYMIQARSRHSVRGILYCDPCGDHRVAILHVRVYGVSVPRT